MKLLLAKSQLWPCGSRKIATSKLRFIISRSIESCKKKTWKTMAVRISQWVNVPTIKPDDVSLILEIHGVERDKQLPLVVP